MNKITEHKYAVEPFMDNEKPRYLKKIETSYISTLPRFRLAKKDQLVLPVFPRLRVVLMITNLSKTQKRTINT